MEPVTSLLGGVVAFAVNLLVGGLGIWAGAALVVGESDYWKAVWTALIAAVATGAVAVVLGVVPLVGGLLALAVNLVLYLGIVRLSYDATWVEAAAVALVAWVATSVVRSVLGALPGL